MYYNEPTIEHKNQMNISYIKRFLEKVKYFGVRKFYWIFRGIWEHLLDFYIEAFRVHPELTQSLIKRNICRRIISIYGGDEGHNLNLHQFFLGFGIIHYGFVRNIKPTRILCVGSRMGFIPAILALACKDNRKGHVDFVDAGYDRDNVKKNWSGIGFWKKNDPHTHFKHLGISSYITTYVMTTQEFADANPKNRYEYIYIDGDHSYKGVRLDYSLFWPKLQKYGFMVFHDVHVRWTKNLGTFGVWRFWKELKNKHKIIFPFPKESGLGILQK